MRYLDFNKDKWKDMRIRGYQFEDVERGEIGMLSDVSCM